MQAWFQRGWSLNRTALLVAAALCAGCQEQGKGGDSTGSLDPAMTLAERILPTSPCTDASDPEKLAMDMVNAINAERERLGLRPLRVSGTLMQVADFYACRLIDGRFFDHYDPFDGSSVDTRATDFGYAFIQIGENLAARQQSVRDAMAALLDSPRHRANILDPIYTEVGVAVKLGGEHGIYWVQEFGRPISDELPPESATDRDTATQPSTATMPSTHGAQTRPTSNPAQSR